MLTQVEDAFRAMKTDLKLRPVFHRKEKRIDARKREINPSFLPFCFSAFLGFF
jgi:hypothetical protein